MAIFLVIKDEVKTHKLQISTTKVSVGRSSKADYKIQSTTASGVHCSFLIKDHKVIVKDLNSKNGTYINGYKISESYLYIGDEVKIGGIFAKLDGSKMSSIERAANTRIEKVVKANEVEIGDPLMASKSIKMLTAIHNLETANIKVERKPKKKPQASRPKPFKKPIKKQKSKFSLFKWIGALFSREDNSDDD